MKRVICIILAIMLNINIFTSASIFASANSGGGNNITVYLNGSEIPFDVKPILQNNRTMVPYRALFEALGYSVSWNGTTKEVIGDNGETEIVLQIGNTVAYVNQEKVLLDTPPIIIDGRTLVPIRFIAENCGCEVAWDGIDYNVYLTLVENVHIPTPTPTDTPAPIEKPDKVPPKGDMDDIPASPYYQYWYSQYSDGSFLGADYPYIDNGYVDPLGYWISSEQYQECEKKREEVLSEIIAQDMTDIDKIRAIHQWIMSHISYDYEGRDANKQDCHFLYNALILGKGVCDAYSKAFAFLANEAGIDTYVVVGNVDWYKPEGEGHAWNIVRIDGQWYHLEPQAQRYSLLSDESMKKEGYISWEPIYPECKQSYWDTHSDSTQESTPTQDSVTEQEPVTIPDITGLRLEEAVQLITNVTGDIGERIKFFIKEGITWNKEEHGRIEKYQCVESDSGQLMVTLYVCYYPEKSIHYLNQVIPDTLNKYVGLSLNEFVESNDYISLGIDQDELQEQYDIDYKGMIFSGMISLNPIVQFQIVSADGNVLNSIMEAEENVKIIHYDITFDCTAQQYNIFDSGSCRDFMIYIKLFVEPIP